MSSKGFFNSRANKKQPTKKGRSVSITSKNGIEASHIDVLFQSFHNVCFISESLNEAATDEHVFLKNTDVIEVGNKLNEAGGLELMRIFAGAFSEYLFKYGSLSQQSHARELELCWDGIGEWKA